MQDPRTELRRSVKMMISELIISNLEAGEFIDLSDWVPILGFSENQIRTEIVRQAKIMRESAARA